MDRTISNQTIPSNTYLADNSIYTENATIPAGGEVTFKSHSIELEDGFESVLGSVFIGEFGDCSSTSNRIFEVVVNNNSKKILITITNKIIDAKYKLTIQNGDNKVLYQLGNIKGTSVELSSKKFKKGMYNVIMEQDGDAFSQQITLSYL